MELEVDPEKLKATAQSLEAAARAIDSEMRTLSAASTTLTGTWEGEAASAYGAAYRRFTGEFGEQQAALVAAASAIASLADAYASADEKGAAATPH